MPARSSTDVRQVHDSNDLERIFAACFYEDYRTRLQGGAEEPVYIPAVSINDDHLLCYRADYFASALHEVAHWCLAGNKRRRQQDFGYWYYPDGRSKVQQRAFEAVEVKPQALEYVFSVACGATFSVSLDNPESGDTRQEQSGLAFARAVSAQKLSYCSEGLPARAERFMRALGHFYNVDLPVNGERAFSRAGANSKIDQ